MKAESRQIPQKLAARLKFAYCCISSVVQLRFVNQRLEVCRKQTDLYSSQLLTQKWRESFLSTLRFQNNWLENDWSNNE